MPTQHKRQNQHPHPWLAGVLLVAAATAVQAAPPPAYHLAKEIPLAGDTGWDYLSIDSQARRLYVTRGTHIAVVDIDTNTVVGDIADTPGVHGFAIAPELGKGFSSNGTESKVSVVDLKSLATLAKIDTEAGPDAIDKAIDRANDAFAGFNGASLPRE